MEADARVYSLYDTQGLDCASFRREKCLSFIKHLGGVGHGPKGIMGKNQNRVVCI